jgi:hypothetical protein
MSNLLYKILIENYISNLEKNKFSLGNLLRIRRSLGRFGTLIIDKGWKGPLNTLSVDSLIDGIFEPDEYLKMVAAKALGKKGESAVLRIIERTLVETNSDIRRWGMYALAQIKDSRALPYFQRNLRHKDPNVRIWAAYALEKMGTGIVKAKQVEEKFGLIKKQMETHWACGKCENWLTDSAVLDAQVQDRFFSCSACHILNVISPTKKIP